MPFYRQIPNAITLGNLLCGCFAITFLLEDNGRAALYCLGLALVFDFLDGAVARALKAQSAIGKQLDSLADLVSFGVVPGIMVYVLHLSVGNWAYTAFLIPLCAAIRLAKFNLDSRQTDQFLGLPTPAVAIFFAGFYQVVTNDILEWSEMLRSPLALISLTVGMSFLMVVEIPLFSLKFKHFRWGGNEIRFIFALVVIFLIAFFKALGLCLAIVVYVLLSIIDSRDGLLRR